MASAHQLWTQGQDEAVTVNQRALIDKVLARYSGNFTVFRELLQNADDASATTVEVHFRSQATATGSSATATSGKSDDTTSNLPVHDRDALPALKTTKLQSIMCRNDGYVFREEDWKRLRTIAEGQPDENKIGAFGVGFFSLFSICENPVCSSGAKVMGFYWKDGGDQLFVKTATNDAGPKDTTEEGKPWTTFTMDLREPAPMPEPFEFARFLASCLGFTANLRSLSMHFDSHLLFRVMRTSGPPRTLAMRPELSPTSPLSILKLIAVNETPVQLKADMTRWLAQTAAKPKPKPIEMASSAVSASQSFASRMLSAFSSKSSTPPPTKQLAPAEPSFKLDPLSFVKISLFLRTVSGTFKVSPSSQFNTEMVRATKKGLPTTTTYSLLWTSKDEFDASNDGQAASSSEEKDAKTVFASLLSDLDTQGRVFIGFPTFQTSGCAASIAARFISTVERESLDFQSRYVADWNRELLAVGGLLARLVYEEEMSVIKRAFRPNLDARDRDRLQQQAVHLMRFFSYSRSTPQEIVSHLTESSFFNTARGNSITVLTQLGPVPAHKARTPNPALAGFVKGVATIPDVLVDGAPTMVGALRARELVRDISLDDVLQDLSAHALTLPEAIKCFQWWISLASNAIYEPRLLARLMDAALLSIPESDGNERIVPLSNFRTFLNPKIIPVDMPAPDHTLPFELTKSLSHNDLVQVFQFQPLSLSDWAAFITSRKLTGVGVRPETNVLVSSEFAEKFLTTMSRSWSTLSAQLQAETSQLLQRFAFVPTRKGHCEPDKSYLPTVDLFDDLPVVVLPSGSAIKGSMESLLLALGVRKHVDLQLVFSRLLGQEGGWSHVDVVRYLVSIRHSLSSLELDRLKKTAWLPREGEAKVAQPPSSDGTPNKAKTIRHLADKLYEPTDEHRELGLPLLDWTTSRWRAGSEEAKLLFDLGLQRRPNADTLLALAASEDESRRELALKYFLSQYTAAGYSTYDSMSKHAFVPGLRSGRNILCKPSEVFSNHEAAVLGFAVLQPRFTGEAAKFKLARDPSGAQLVSALFERPPRDMFSASEVFAYLSSRTSNFTNQQWPVISRARIIPVGDRMLEPASCFFNTDSTLPEGLKSLFVTLPDFGPAAKPFLLSAGVKEKPSIAEIAAFVVDDSENFFDLCGSSERYLGVLRMLAANHMSLPSGVRSRMRSAPFFLATKRAPSSGNNAVASNSLLDSQDTDEEDDDEEGIGRTTLQYKLARAIDMAVNDDPTAYRVFQTHILICPQEDALEALAEQLGSPRLSKLVSEHHRDAGQPEIGSKRAREMHKKRKQQYGKGELRHDAEWIQTHLQVYEVRSIELVRTLNFGKEFRKHAQAVSAYSKLATRGADVCLYIASNLEIDYYEVASSLCRLLLTKLRPNDALLFMTILSTPLRALSRRGFNVERIIAARKHEREAADRRLQEERSRLQEKQREVALNTSPEEARRQLQTLYPDADPEYLSTVVDQQDRPYLENAIAAMKQLADYPRRPPSYDDALGPVKTSSFSSKGGLKDATQLTPSSSSNGGLFSSLKRQLGRSESRASVSSGGSSPKQPSTVTSAPLPPVLAKPSTSSSGGRSGTPPTAPTSTDAIQSNVRKAVQASRPEMGTSISNAVDKTAVKESQSTYCDATAGANLEYAGDIAGMRFYLDRQTPDSDDFPRLHHDAITRFVTKVVQPVANVFELDPRALHIFHDQQGPLVAFNRNGGLYLNLRFYEAWHDADVVADRCHDAIISVYHTLAHEIAHNLVKPHDAEHSWWMSSISETYMMRLVNLLSSTN
ncbi:hypothetical protein OIO90_005106 [Microbotryomycetes sp. JL221]|nr:hypothetical protein OIO90_005106 [Microbotryomycetes sp. JL221]